jgi:hypothetical protein
MKSTAIALLGALSLGIAASPALAQDAAREAAIRTCVQRVAAIVGMDPENQAQRVAAFKACMTQQGQNP